jgi:hypothetical protein
MVEILVEPSEIATELTEEAVIRILHVDDELDFTKSTKQMRARTPLLGR